jgi:hypothetical protein
MRKMKKAELRSSLAKKSAKEGKMPGKLSLSTER